MSNPNAKWAPLMSVFMQFVVGVLKRSGWGERFSLSASLCMTWSRRLRDKIVIGLVPKSIAVLKNHVYRVSTYHRYSIYLVFSVGRLFLVGFDYRRAFYLDMGVAPVLTVVWGIPLDTMADLVLMPALLQRWGPRFPESASCMVHLSAGHPRRNAGTHVNVISLGYSLFNWNVVTDSFSCGYMGAYILLGIAISVGHMIDCEDDFNLFAFLLYMPLESCH